MKRRHFLSLGLGLTLLRTVSSAFTCNTRAATRPCGKTRTRDKRIRAALALSPAPEPSEALNRERFGSIAIPFLNLTGTADHLPLINDVSAEERRIPYQFMHAPDKYLLVLTGADHMVFNGQPAERKWSEQNRNVNGPLIERVTLAFWNAYLKGDGEAKAELTGGGFKIAVGVNGEWFAK